MKQTTYALVVFICLFITAGTVETFPFISFTGLGVMAWAIRKGQLWEYKEKKPAENSDRQTKISLLQNNIK